ncbi:MAG: preprotein translocase subunit SecG [Desulfovibrionaceae bacterium]
MKALILGIHVLVSIVLIVLVILQAGKDSIGTVFGGGNTGSVFGGTGAGSTLSKMTAWFAVLFFVTSLSYTYVSSEGNRKESVIINIENPVPSVKEGIPILEGEK